MVPTDGKDGLSVKKFIASLIMGGFILGLMGCTTSTTKKEEKKTTAEEKKETK
jgi:hypothetical protein